MHVREAPGQVTDVGVHSRSVLAGYDPARLGAARIAVVGLGALGQNVLLNLALSGVGNLLLIDFDEFEDHNATRSPFYPTPDDSARHGLRKAPVVASRTARCSTASDPGIAYFAGLVQLAGDAPIRWADVVVCAVDSVQARAWLAERCRVHATPMIEGGFSGPEFNLSVFAGDDDAVCYRCFNPGRTSSGSCREYALRAEAASVVPAIQTTAAVLGGLIAEHAVQVLHGQENWFGQRAYGNVRGPALHVVRLQANPQCPGKHSGLPRVADLDEVPETLDALVSALHAQIGGGWLELAEPAVITMPCTRCTAMCLVQTTESAWMRAPRCADCEGPYPRSEQSAPQAVHVLALAEAPPHLAGRTPLAALGLRAGGAVTVATGDGRYGLATLPGDGAAEWQKA